MIGDPKDGAAGSDSAPLLGEVDASGYRRPLPGFSTNAPAFSANGGAAEGFEAALGIVELREGNDAHHCIEDAAHEMAISGLIVAFRAFALS